MPPRSRPRCARRASGRARRPGCHRVTTSRRPRRDTRPGRVREARDRSRPGARRPTPPLRPWAGSHPSPGCSRSLASVSRTLRVSVGRSLRREGTPSTIACRRSATGTSGRSSAAVEPDERATLEADLRDERGEVRVRVRPRLEVAGFVFPPPPVAVDEVLARRIAPRDDVAADDQRDLQRARPRLGMAASRKGAAGAAGSWRVHRGWCASRARRTGRDRCVASDRPRRPTRTATRLRPHRRARLRGAPPPRRSGPGRGR